MIEHNKPREDPHHAAQTTIASPLNTSFTVANLETELRETFTKQVSQTVKAELTKQISDKSFLKRSLHYLGEKVWEGLNTRTGKIIGGALVGLAAWQTGAFLGQPFAGFVLGAVAGATGWSKFSPYHAALGVGVGIAAIAVTAPFGVALMGWSVAAIAVPTTTLIAGKLKLWAPTSHRSQT